MSRTNCNHDTPSSKLDKTGGNTSLQNLVETELLRETLYEQLLDCVRSEILRFGSRVRLSDMQISHILLRYIFNKKATTTPGPKSDPVFVIGTSKLARHQLQRDLEKLNSHAVEELADVIDDGLASATRKLRFERLGTDKTVTLSSTAGNELTYGDRSQKDFAGLAHRYGPQHYNAAYALGLRYTYMRLTGHGLAREYEEDTKRRSADPLVCEGFASAFNHYFDRYYSAFPDLEAAFGSRGCFFKIDWEQEPEDMTYYLCPPFDESLMDLCVARVLNVLEERLVARPTFVFSIPGSWTNFSALDKLKASSWVRDTTDYSKGKLRFIDYMATRDKDRIIYPTDICVITLSAEGGKPRDPESKVALQPTPKKRKYETSERTASSSEDEDTTKKIKVDLVR